MSVPLPERQHPPDDGSRMPMSSGRAGGPCSRGGLSRSIGVRVAAALALVRPANVFTAGADSTAGFLIAGGDLAAHGSVTVRLILASMALYAGGVALNDVADAKADAIQRRERPIPAGALSRVLAALIGAALLAGGLAAALSVSLRSGVVAGVCIVAVLLYDFVLRRTALAPIVMGCCRAANLALGMSAVGGLSSGLVWPVVILWAYVSSLTLFARRETGFLSRDPLIVGSIGLVGAIVGTVVLIPWSQAYGWIWLGAVGIGSTWAGRLGLRTVHAARAESVQAAVKWFVLGVVGLDALMAGVVRGPGAGLVVLAFLIPGMLLARRFSVA